MAAQKKMVVDLDEVLNGGAKAKGKGPFAVSWREAKNGETYANIEIQDERIFYRFRSINPKALAFILKNTEAAHKALAVSLQDPPTN